MRRTLAVTPNASLPGDIRRATSARYLEAFHRLTGAPLGD